MLNLELHSVDSKQFSPQVHFPAGSLNDWLAIVKTTIYHLIMPPKRTTLISGFFLFIQLRKFKNDVVEIDI